MSLRKDSFFLRAARKDTCLCTKKGYVKYPFFRDTLSIPFFGSKCPFEKILFSYAHERDTFLFFFRVLKQVSLRRDTGFLRKMQVSLALCIFSGVGTSIPSKGHVSRKKGYLTYYEKVRIPSWNKIEYLFLRASLYPFAK